MKKNQLFLLLSFLFIQLHANDQKEETTVTPGLIRRIKKQLSPSFLKDLSKAKQVYLQTKKKYSACMQQHCPKEYQDRKQLKITKDKRFLLPWNKGYAEAYGKHQDIRDRFDQCGGIHCSKKQNKYNAAMKELDKKSAKVFVFLMATTVLSMVAIELIIYHFTGVHFFVD